jgi:L-ribulose-5-phosphate 3-epimerase
MANTDFSINTFSWIWTVPITDCLARLADRGHTSFEAITTPGHIWPAELDAGKRREIGRMLESRGLAFTSFNPGGWDNNMVSPSREMRDHTFRYLSACIDLAADWGVPAIVISPGLARPLLAAPRERMMDWLRESLDRLVPAAEKAGTNLLFENIPYTWLPKAKHLMSALDELGYGDTLALIYDVANGVFARDDPMADIRLVLPRMKLVHISDTTTDAFRHDPVGKGVVPFREVGETLRETGYAGPVVLEIISPDPDVDFPDSIRRLGEMGW